MTTDKEMSRRLAELLEPEPGGNWWVKEKQSWRPRTFDDNTIRRVREELKRRGLAQQFASECWRAINNSFYTQILPFDLIDAPLAVQIAAAVEVLKEAAKK